MIFGYANVGKLKEAIKCRKIRINKQVLIQQYKP